MAIIQKITVPRDAVSDEFATVATIYVKDGDAVKKGDELLELETSKTVFVIEAEQGGFVRLFCKEGEDVAIGANLINIVEGREEETIVPWPGQGVHEYESPNKSSKLDTKFSKKALELIKDNNINISKFDDMDFVTEEDVKEFISHKPTIQNNLSSSQGGNQDYDPDLIQIESLGKNKQIEIKYLSDVQSGGMNSVLNVVVESGNIKDAIKGTLGVFQNSYLSLIVYETSRLLKKYRMLNAFYAGDNKVGFYNKVNLGVAIDIDDGLKVLTLPNAEKMNLNEIEVKLFGLIEKYLDRKLALADITSSTFTVTDLSSAGIDFFTPLINTKQSAILGVSQIDKKFRRFVLTLVFDHRVTEGRVASNFLVDLKNRIESFRQEALDVKCASCFKSLYEDRGMGGIGLIKIINHNGKEELVCRVCLGGF